jgi:hypothetical protein
MTSINTDPNIASTIIEYLDSWRNDIPPSGQLDTDINTLIQLQSQIGWQSFLEGFTHRKWEEAQISYYKSIHSLRSGKRWITQLIIKLWGVAWDLWDHRNQVLHRQNSSSTMQEVEAMNAKISSLYSSLVGLLPPEDAYLFNTPLDLLLKKTIASKKEWISQANAPLSMQRSRVICSLRPELERQRSIARMRRNMRNWLGVRASEP